MGILRSRHAAFEESSNGASGASSHDRHLPAPCPRNSAAHPHIPEPPRYDCAPLRNVLPCIRETRRPFHVIPDASLFARPYLERTFAVPDASHILHLHIHQFEAEAPVHPRTPGAKCEQAARVVTGAIRRDRPRVAGAIRWALLELILARRGGADLAVAFETGPVRSERHHHRQRSGDYSNHEPCGCDASSYPRAPGGRRGPALWVRRRRNCVSFFHDPLRLGIRRRSPRAASLCYTAMRNIIPPRDSPPSDAITALRSAGPDASRRVCAALARPAPGTAITTSPRRCVRITNLPPAGVITVVTARQNGSPSQAAPLCAER